MQDFKLVAFDMDGTLLNSAKRVSSKTVEALKSAAEAGVVTAVATGRCLAEVRDYFDSLPGVKFLVCSSGAAVYDAQRLERLGGTLLEESLVQKCLELSAAEDVMVHILTEASIVDFADVERMEVFKMQPFRELYERVATKVHGIREVYAAAPFPAEKLNFYHKTPAARARTRARFSCLALEMFDAAEGNSLECSKRGVTKASGMEILCGFLKIPMSSVIAVGDSDNDLELLNAVGFSVAMGNSNARVKAACNAVVSDCDHDGCAEAIEKFVLGH